MSSKNAVAAPSTSGSSSLSAFVRAWTYLLAAPLFTACAGGSAYLTTPPDPFEYLTSCSPEARATPGKLGIPVDEMQDAYSLTVTPASAFPIAEGPVNVRPGPLSARMAVGTRSAKKEYEVSGTARLTRKRIYIHLERIHLADGSTRPLCGVAVEGGYPARYGLPTEDAFTSAELRSSFEHPVDPYRVDRSVGSVVQPAPRYQVVLKGAEGAQEYPLELVEPDKR